MPANTITRIFHPVGQGAFYSERHPGFNMVYDCGNWKNTNASTRVVKQSFRKTDVIDVLFISHFDADHVNKIPILQERCKIGTVVLPLLHDDERKLLSNLFTVIGLPQLSAMVGDPASFFPDSNIIEIEPGEESLENPNDEGYNIPDQKSSRGGVQKRLLKSGTRLTTGVANWLYIPYNYKHHERRQNLEFYFKKESLEIEQFIEDLQYALANKRKVTEIYNAIEGKINENSMLVCSCPTDLNSNRYEMFNYFHAHSYEPFMHFYLDKPGCIYSGDSNFNIVKIDQIFRNHYNCVETVQIPHHGDIKCFNADFLSAHQMICPISVGLTNSYGHPSTTVLAELVSTHSTPIIINENIESTFIQVINKIPIGS